MRRNILIVGLDESVAADLSRTLVELRHFVLAQPFLPVEDCAAAVDRTAADLLFCSADSRVYVPLLDGLRRSRIDIPIVVVSAEPDPESLLDALDAGARDYCSAPFGPRMLRCIIENAAGSLVSVG